MVQHFHAGRGVDTSTFVISEFASRKEMQSAQGFFVDEHWLQQENTLKLVKGGGRKPSAVDREWVDGFVANWIGRQSSSWRQHAEILFRAHKEKCATRQNLGKEFLFLFCLSSNKDNSWFENLTQEKGSKRMRERRQSSGR